MASRNETNTLASTRRLRASDAVVNAIFALSRSYKLGPQHTN